MATQNGADAIPVWRSMLFIPANVEKFIDKAHLRGADALILDLEDSIALAQKDNARINLAETAKKVRANGADVLVRINSNWRMAIKDLEQAVDSSICAIVIPKVISAYQLQAFDEIVSEIEQEKGLSLGSTRFVALIESPAALKQMDAIAQSTPRLLAMILGSEDFSAAMGMIANADNLLVANQQLLFSCRAAGLIPLGYVGSIANYSDLDAFQKIIERSRGMGFRGGFCIHPNQVAVLNEGFSPTAEQVADAMAILDVYQKGLEEGKGAVEHKGKMVDAPIVAQAQEIAQMYKRIQAKNNQ